MKDYEFVENCREERLEGREFRRNCDYFGF